MKPLTTEQRRILEAVHRGAFVKNEHGRYLIVGEPRPDRRERERMFKRGYIGRSYEPIGPSFALTEDGRKALANGNR